MKPSDARVVNEALDELIVDGGYETHADKLVRILGRSKLVIVPEEELEDASEARLGQAYVNGFMAAIEAIEEHLKNDGELEPEKAVVSFAGEQTIDDAVSLERVLQVVRSAEDDLTDD